MLQDTDYMEASCIFYVKVCMFTHLEQSKHSLLTVNRTAILRVTLQHDLIASVSFMQYPRDSLRQTSADVLSLVQCLIDVGQSCDFGSRTVQFIPVNKQTTADLSIAHLWAVGNACNLWPYTAGFILSIWNILAATYSILT